MYSNFLNIKLVLFLDFNSMLKFVLAWIGDWVTESWGSIAWNGLLEITWSDLLLKTRPYVKLYWALLSQSLNISVKVDATTPWAKYYSTWEFL